MAFFGVGTNVNHFKKFSQPPFLNFTSGFLGALMEENDPKKFFDQQANPHVINVINNLRKFIIDRDFRRCYSYGTKKIDNSGKEQFTMNRPLQRMVKAIIIIS
ncbi:hypothetical protein M3N64_08625 [Sporolactobacillus sp. CPB3-1]|uniref:Uncharacterized protein n=1 Tax=Sporolactobacillus mangiferae TaxID=2940498 RepID=A0ABT0MAW0_9BACL|nr:hypothetical protein [Sporolactobacillus mangiferae]MCL1632012.1 hypothetical protein [Sporolactobacillus mangiferae]